jgi:hypothetical protein
VSNHHYGHRNTAWVTGPTRTPSGPPRRLCQKPTDEATRPAALGRRHPESELNCGVVEFTPVEAGYE